jgi:predicted DNA-binding transcriptional regulator AlpA
MRVRSIRNSTAGEAADDRQSTATPAIVKPSTVLTEAEAAQFIGMSAAWLKKSRTKRFRGVIDAPPFIRAGVKRVVYRIADLEAWQERHLEHVGPSRAGEAAHTETIPQESAVAATAAMVGRLHRVVTCLS